MGIRRARVVRETRRTVTVAGRSFRGGRTFVTFGNRGGCPVLDVNR
ncbi:hypothetical protein [Mangrovicella endophytica]|nr:hypothetical protein [Mangrovicella endophytica]